MWFISRRVVDQACFIQLQGEDPVPGSTSIPGSFSTYDMALGEARNKLRDGTCKCIPTRTSLYVDLFKQVYRLTDAQSVKAQVVTNKLLACSQAVDSNDGKTGGYLTAGDRLRKLTHLVTSFGHDIEIVLTQKFLNSILDLKTEEPQQIPPRRVPSGVKLTYSITGPLALESPNPEKSCFDIGIDQLGILIRFSALTPFSPFPQEFSAWVTVSLDPTGNLVVGSLSRGPRFDLPASLQQLEASFSLRSRMGNAIRDTIEQRLQDNSVDLSQELSELRSLGSEFVLYDTKSGPILSIFGKAKNLSRRPRQRLDILGQLPLANPPWDIGIKIARAVIEQKIKTLVKEGDPIDEYTKEAKVTEILFNEVANTITIRFEKSFKAEQRVVYEKIRLPPFPPIEASVTIGVEATIEGLLQVSFVKRNDSELFAHISTLGQPTVIKKGLKPRFAESIPEVKSMFATLLTIFLRNQSWPNFTKPILDYPGAKNVGWLVKADGLVLLFSMT